MADIVHDGKHKSFRIRLLCLGMDGTFLRSVGGILCIYFGIWFALIGVVLTFIFPQRSANLLKVLDPMISEWWYSIKFCGQMITLTWGVIATVIVYTHPDSIFSLLSSKLIYGLGNVCAAKLGAEIAILNMKRCKCSAKRDEMEIINEINCDNDEMMEREGENITLLGSRDTV
eukprot:292177_1